MKTLADVQAKVVLWGVLAFISLLAFDHKLQFVTQYVSEEAVLWSCGLIILLGIAREFETIRKKLDAIQLKLDKLPTQRLQLDKLPTQHFHDLDD
jgi:hypothetical protein